jgi:hypothetical protein
MRKGSIYKWLAHLVVVATAVVTAAAITVAVHPIATAVQTRSTIGLLPAIHSTLCRCVSAQPLNVLSRKIPALLL